MAKLVTSEGPQAALETHRAFKASRHLRSGSFIPRKAGELREAMDIRIQKEKERAAAAKIAREKKAADDRLRHLRSFTGRETELWTRITTPTATTTPANYDVAVRILIDLRDLAELDGGSDQFELKFAELRGLRLKKPSLLERFAKAGLTGPRPSTLRE